MSGPRRIVVAREGFKSSHSFSLREQRLGVSHEGFVIPGARFWSDDPIVEHNPDMFLDASKLPPAVVESTPAGRAGSDDLWTNPEWLAIVKAYRACGHARPSQVEVARGLGFDTEQPLRDRLRPLGIASWHAVHALIAASRDR